MHKVYYQPEGIWVGDIMPYGEDGTFYLYHQRDTRNPGPFGEPFGWALATTKDFVNYKDFGESLERGGARKSTSMFMPARCLRWATSTMRSTLVAIAIRSRHA